MKNDGSWDFSFWGIILTGVLFLMAYGAGQWTARQAEAGFFGPSDHLEASADGNWGLGFPEKGKTPVGNASAEYLKQYHAWYAGNPDEKVIYLTFDAGYEN